MPPKIESSAATATVSAPPQSAATPSNDDEDQDPKPSSEVRQYVVDVAPPWLTSLVTHLLLLVILALFAMPITGQRPFIIDAVFSDRVGEQTEELLMTIEPITTAVEESFDASLVELPKVDSPLFTPPELHLADSGAKSDAAVEAPRIALALTGREAGRKEALLRAFGGTAETEEAVKLALEWLKRYQKRQGFWSLRGPYQSGAQVENREAATGMALLAFLGAGNTTEKGMYQDNVYRGMQFLIDRQTEEGSFYRSGKGDQHFNHRFYTHAIATLAICECYGMSRDAGLKRPAQAAVDYLVELQSPLGGWRYDPGVDADTSVTGWVLMAVQSAQAAGLHVPSRVFRDIGKYLDLAQSYDGARYGYKPGHEESMSMTAEGLLCRQYLGWKRDDPRLRRGVRYIGDNPIRWRDPNMYYWYYATQVLHHMEGDDWNRWNQVLRVELPKSQNRSGREKGSWYSEKDNWGRFGGRLFSTCLCTYMMEVYYRHLPIYSPVFRFEGT